MATPTLSTSTPATATPAALAAWTSDPRARLLLASCVASPPIYVERETRYARRADRWCEYAGYRAEALEAIRMEHGERVHGAYMARGDDAYPAFEAWCRQPSATDAIIAALAAAGQEG